MYNLLANVPILYPLETPGNQNTSNVFRVKKMGTMSRKDLIKFIIATWCPAQKIWFLLACCFMRLSGGGGDGGSNELKNHFKEGDINEKLIDKMVQVSEKHCSFD